MTKRTPNSSHENLPDRLAGSLAAGIVRHPRRPIVIALLLAITGAIFAARNLELDADTNHLIGDDRPFMIRFNAWLEEFGDLEYLYVVVDPGDDPDERDHPRNGAPNPADQAVRSLVERLRDVPDLPAVHGWIDAREQWGLATRAMAIDELAGLVRAGDAVPILAGDATAAGVLRAGTDRLNRITGLEAFTHDEAERTTLAAGGVLLLEAIAAAELDGIPPPAGFEPLPLARARSDEFLVNPGGRLRFVEILPRKDFGSLAAIEGPLRSIRAVMELVAAEHPGVEIGLTGKPVLQADELATSDADMTRSATVAFMVIAILFMVSFRNVRRPLFAAFAFLLAFAWTYGAATMLVGRLNLLSIVFMLVLVGVGFDYGIHVVARWTEARRRASPAAAIDETLRTAGVGNLFGAITSAGVFLLALATDFGGLRELGVVAGIGLLLCVVAMSVVLPAILLLAEGGREEPDDRPSPIAGSKARRIPTARNPAFTISIGLLVSILSGVAVVAGLRFEDNLLALQADGLDSVEWERRVLEDSSSASWFAAVVVDSEAEIERAVDRAAAHPEIGLVRSVLDVVRPSTAERAGLRERFAAAFEADEPDTTADPEEPRLTADDLHSAAARLRGIADAARTLDANASERLGSIAIRLEGLAALLGPDAGEEARASTRIAIDLARSRTRDALQAMAAGDVLPLREALPAAIRARMMSPAGRFQIELVPAEDVWDADPMRRFVAAVRAVDPDATGVPITQYESLRDMRRSFLVMGVLALGLVTLVVFLDFRSVRDTALVMISLLTGLLWTIGIASLLGVSLNVANFFAIPILIGIGVDSAIHMLHRARECGDGPLDFKSTRNAVILTACTTGVGFGSLLLARHRGLQSLGAIMAIGSLTCMMASVVLLPGMLAIGRNPRNGSRA